MKDTRPSGDSLVSRATLAEAVVGLVLLVLTFSAVALSDVSSLALQTWWIALTGIFALATLAIDRVHANHGLGGAGSALRIVLHWLGVLCAVQLVYFFVASGRMANADTGLTNGLLIALGAFLAGIHVNWRLVILGLAIGAASAGIAFVDQYLWVLFGISVLAVIVLVIGMGVSRGRDRP